MKKILVFLLAFTTVLNAWAHRTAEDILDTEAGPAVVLSKVGGEIGKYVSKDQGIKILQDALAKAGAVKNQAYREVALAQIANEFAGLNEIDKAIEITQSLHDKHLLSTNLGKIAQKMAADQPAAAARLLEKAVTAARQNTDPNEIPPVLAELSGKWVKLNRADLSKALLEEALARAADLKKIDLFEKLQVYAEIGANLIASGQKDKALALFEKAYIESGNLTDPFEKAAVLAMLGGELAEKGQPDQAKSMLQKALSASEQIGDINRRNDIQSEIARNFSQAKEYETAAKISSGIKDEYFLTEGLIRTAKNQAKVKQYSEATQLLNVCIEKSRHISSVQKRSMVWAKVASELAGIGKVQEAADLLQKAYKSLV